MRARIHVISNSSLREKYKRLLSSDWKKGTLDEVLELLWKELEKPAQRPSFFEVLDPHRSALPAWGFNKEVLEEMKHFRQHFPANGLIPPVPEATNRKAGRLRAQAETAWTYLILENLARLDGDTGFF